MNTREMMKVALDLAGLEKCTQDAYIIYPGENIKRVLVGIDMSTPELIIAKMTGYDCVVSHHPRCMETNRILDLFSEQTFFLNEKGVPLNRAQKIMEPQIEEMKNSFHPLGAGCDVTAAELLNMPFMCIHTPADLIVESSLQKLMDEHINEDAKLSDILSLLNDLPEYKNAMMGPKIAVGTENSYCGKVLVRMAGVTDPGFEAYKALFEAGYGTIVVMHMPEECVKKLKKLNIGNVINAGHMPSDSYGMNRILEVWEERGVEVVRMGGLVPTNRSVRRSFEENY